MTHLGTVSEHIQADHLDLRCRRLLFRCSGDDISRIATKPPSSRQGPTTSVAESHPMRSIRQTPVGSGISERRFSTDDEKNRRVKLTRCARKHKRIWLDLRVNRPRHSKSISELASHSSPERRIAWCVEANVECRKERRSRWRISLPLDHRTIIETSDAGGCCFGAGIGERRRAISYSADLPRPIWLTSTSRRSSDSKLCSIVPIPICSTGSSSASRHRKNMSTT